MTKTDERKARRLKKKNEKWLKQQSKNARLAVSTQIPKDKYIRCTSKPLFTKTPRAQDPDNYKKKYFSWCDSKADIEGEWSWREPRNWDDKEHSKIISPHMDSQINDPWSVIETKTYNGSKGKRKLLNKYQHVDSLCSEAKSRWLNLDTLSEFEELFRLRLGSNKRAWGIRIQHHFFMVWYERYHKICPTKKSN